MNSIIVPIDIGRWSKMPPELPGWYCVWQAEDTWPCNGFVYSVLVESDTIGFLSAWVPCMDFDAPVLVADDNDTWMDSWWLGPVAMPGPPDMIPSA